VELQIEILLFANLMFAASVSLIYVNGHEIVMVWFRVATRGEALGSRPT